MVQHVLSRHLEKEKENWHQASPGRAHLLCMKSWLPGLLTHLPASRFSCPDAQGCHGSSSRGLVGSGLISPQAPDPRAPHFHACPSSLVELASPQHTPCACFCGSEHAPPLPAHYTRAPTGGIGRAAQSWGPPQPRARQQQGQWDLQRGRASCEGSPHQLRGTNTCLPLASALSHQDGQHFAIFSSPRPSYMARPALYPCWHPTSHLDNALGIELVPLWFTLSCSLSEASKT